jgi:hypothetical protein
MPRRPFPRSERWCFPEDLPRILTTNKDEPWCFPDNPPRAPVPDPDDRWCFPDDVPRPRRSKRIGSR